MRILYCRVSTTAQETARQEKLKDEMGCEKMYVDMATGRNISRPALQEMLGFARSGDYICVESISRFARNTRDLLELIELLKSKGIGFISQKEAIDTSTPTGQFMLTIFGAVAQLEREYIVQRVKEGLEIAASKGRVGGRKRVETDKKLWVDVFKRWKQGELKATEAQRLLNLKARTFYRRVAEYESRGVNNDK